MDWICRFFFRRVRTVGLVGGSRGEEKSSTLEIRGDICENPIKCDHVRCSLTGHLFILTGNRGDWMINMSNVIDFIVNDYYSSLSDSQGISLFWHVKKRFIREYVIITKIRSIDCGIL